MAYFIYFPSHFCHHPSAILRSIGFSAYDINNTSPRFFSPLSHMIINRSPFGALGKAKPNGCSDDRDPLSPDLLDLEVVFSYRVLGDRHSDIIISLALSAVTRS